eukprot:TRINITY_DN63831_c0_g1_i1.p1 TRINITY_DN63831_c0_g1~~TRINITY_DN63831_c0_g1_i1.p1  ORF type:complete len:466 (-),score=152.30 TRINITY_DN63831_c0_g1_i1:78-1475(-)
MSAGAAGLAVQELSLIGLIVRLVEVDRLKADVPHPDESQALLLESEAACKKAVVEQLEAAAASGVTSSEKKRAKEFLETWSKNVDPNAKGAEARLAKFKELLRGVEAASSKEEYAHVRKAKAAVDAAQKAHEAVSKDYEKWEKGKKMLSVDEVKTLKRSYEDGQKKIDKARSFIEEQMWRRAEAAAAPQKAEAERGAAAMVVDKRLGTGRGKGGGKTSNPTVKTVQGGMTVARGGGGYAAAPAAQPSSAQVRQAQIAAQVRAEADAEAAAAAAAPARPRPQPKKQPEETVVLSYACTCQAVAEHLKIKEAKARDMAESAKEFAQHFDPETWSSIQERSVAIEKENREKQKEQERLKKERALAKITAVESSMAANPRAAADPKAAAKSAARAAARPAMNAVPGAVSGGAGYATAKAKVAPKAKVAAKSMPRTTAASGIEAYSGKNAFAGLGGDSDDDDGFTSVRRR